MRGPLTLRVHYIRFSLYLYRYNPSQRPFLFALLLLTSPLNGVGASCSHKHARALLERGTLEPRYSFHVADLNVCCYPMTQLGLKEERGENIINKTLRFWPVLAVCMAEIFAKFYCVPLHRGRVSACLSKSSGRYTFQTFRGSCQDCFR